MIHRLTVEVSGQGLHAITDLVEEVVVHSDIDEGICHLFIQHTSASLLVQENYDASAKADLENWLNRLVPEEDPLFTHTLEGADDMPAHIKSMLTATSIGIPILDGRLALGAWQGLFLWEHRRGRAKRTLVVHISN